MASLCVVERFVVPKIPHLVDRYAARWFEIKLKDVDTRAQHGELAGVDIVEELMTITPYKKSAPHAAELLEEEACALLPHVKITELLLETDRMLGIGMTNIGFVGIRVLDRLMEQYTLRTLANGVSA